MVRRKKLAVMEYRRGFSRSCGDLSHVKKNILPYYSFRVFFFSVLNSLPSFNARFICCHVVMVCVYVKDPRVYISRGDANTLLGQEREALDNYVRAVNLSPMTPEVTSNKNNAFHLSISQ